MKRIVFTLLVALALLASPLVNTASAAAYPDRPIVVVIPFSAGGSHDLHARGITSIMADILGQPMIVKLLPGGAGMKATGFVANSRPDGYTIIFTHNGIDMIVPQTRKVPFDTQKVLKTVVKINHSDGVLAVNSKSPFKTFADMVKAAKKNPGGLNWGHSGVWGSSYTSTMQILKATGIKVNLIPHKGGGPLLRATLAGRLDVGSCQTTQCRPLVKAGKMRPLVVMGPDRFKNDPEFGHVPSLKELGYGEIGFRMDRIFQAPSGVPAARMKVLKDAFAKLMKHRSFKRFMRSIGMPVNYESGSDYDKSRPRRFKEYTELIKSVTAK
jgi:tripartite-type tricarboxylate transporter receptor subunit TctC